MPSSSICPQLDSVVWTQPDLYTKLSSCICLPHMASVKIDTLGSHFQIINTMGTANSTEEVVLVAHKPVAVISSQYCTKQPISLQIQGKLLAKHATVTDVDTGVEHFKVEQKLLSLRRKILLHDASENVIVTVERKILALNKEDEVFNSTGGLMCTIVTTIGLLEATIRCRCKDLVSGEDLDFQLTIKKYASTAVILCNGVPVAKIGSKHSLTTSNYLMQVAPGMDLALAVLMCSTISDAKAHLEKPATVPVKLK